MAKHENITKFETGRRRRMSARTGALIAIAAVLLMTAAAGVTALKLYAGPVGDYGTAVSMTGDTASAGSVEFSAESAIDPKDTRHMELEATWLPEGMVSWENGWKYHYEATPYQGGFSVTNWVLNTGKETFCQVVEDSTVKENLTVGGHEAVLLEKTSVLDEDKISFDKRLFVAYPEYNIVLEIYVGSDVDRDTMLRFAEGLNLTQGDSGYMGDIDYHGSLYKEARQQIENGGIRVPTAEDLLAAAQWERDQKALRQRIQNSMEDVRQIGETYTVPFSADGMHGEDRPVLDVKVTEVAVADDLSPLENPELAKEQLLDELGEDGKFVTDTVNYVINGTGTTSPSETVVDSFETAQKLVAVTFELTNNTGKDLEDIGYFPAVDAIAPGEDGYWYYEGETDVEYDHLLHAGLEECQYFGVQCADGEHNGTNYIPSLAAGETISVQTAWLVGEYQLPYLYFDMAGEGYFENADGTQMDRTLVDIRQ